MSVAVFIDDGGTIRAVDRRFANLSSLDLRGLLEAVGAEAESHARIRIQEEKRSPEGVDWPDRSDNYLKRLQSLGKDTSRQSLLQFQGELLDSLQFDVRGDSVMVGSNKEYAAIHQFGGNGIPAREYLGVGDENRDDIEAIMEKFLEDALR